MASSNKLAVRAHRQLLLLHGEGPGGRQCRDCRNLERQSMESSWFKCRLVAPTGPAGDWRAGWESCGAFEEVKDG